MVMVSQSHTDVLPVGTWLGRREGGRGGKGTSRDESTAKATTLFIACIQIKRKLRGLCRGVLQLTRVSNLNGYHRLPGGGGRI